MNETTWNLLRKYPVGHHQFHPDKNFNFQMNRWLVWGMDPVIQVDLEAVAGRIATQVDWVREFRALSSGALAAGERRRAAIYARAAEFFMDGGDPARAPLRELFITSMRAEAGLGPGAIEQVPYPAGGATATLPVVRLGVGGPKGCLVLFGGFDSYLEELLPHAHGFAAEGYDVLLFEGPGQGAVLEAGVPMTDAWELPVRAVLDHFHVSQAVAVGISLGGYLVLRAAAREPRIVAAVAWDVIWDFSQVLLAQLAPPVRALARVALAAGATPLVDAALRARMELDPVVGWGLRHGMRVFGVRRPVDLLRAAARCSAASFSKDLTCDVLLLAGAEDHFVPLEMLHRQARALTNAASVTTRVFTAVDAGQAHCQVGNMPLVVGIIVDWLEEAARARAARPVGRA